MSGVKVDAVIATNNGPELIIQWAIGTVEAPQPMVQNACVASPHGRMKFVILTSKFDDCY